MSTTKIGQKHNMVAVFEILYIKYAEMENRFTLMLSVVKNIDYIKKYFKQKLRRIKFPIKNS